MLNMNQKEKKRAEYIDKMILDIDRDSSQSIHRSILSPLLCERDPFRNQCCVSSPLHGCELDQREVVISKDGRSDEWHGDGLWFH